LTAWPPATSGHVAQRLERALAAPVDEQRGTGDALQVAEHRQPRAGDARQARDRARVDRVGNRDEHLAQRGGQAARVPGVERQLAERGAPATLDRLGARRARLRRDECLGI